MKNLVPSERIKIKDSIKKERPWLYVLAALLLFVGVLFGVSVYYNSKSVSFLKEINVSEAIITEKVNDNGKLYIKFEPGQGGPTESITPDNLYAEALPEYYNKHNLQDRVGVLFGKYESYKHKYFGKGQKLVDTEWIIDNVYDSYDIAVESNKSKNIRSEAEIIDKKILKNGTSSLVLKYNDISYAVEVSKDLFDKYSIGQKLNCEFETRGEMTKFIGILSS